MQFNFGQYILWQFKLDEREHCYSEFEVVIWEMARRCFQWYRYTLQHCFTNKNCYGPHTLVINTFPSNINHMNAPWPGFKQGCVLSSPGRLQTTTCLSTPTSTLHSSLNIHLLQCSFTVFPSNLHNASRLLTFSARIQIFFSITHFWNLSYFFPLECLFWLSSRSKLLHIAQL